MAKRKRGAASGSLAENDTKSGKFDIPTLLKTEQIEVENNIKPEILTPCTDSKSSNITISSDNILTFTCGGCGASGIHHLGLEYRLVKTARLVVVGTQTGPNETLEALGLNHVSVPTSSTASPSVIPSDNEDVWDFPDSDKGDSLGESGGEEEIHNSEDDMMSDLKRETLSDSIEEEWVLQTSYHKPTSQHIPVLKSLPQRSTDNQSASTCNSAVHRANSRNKQKVKLIQDPCVSPDTHLNQVNSNGTSTSDKLYKVIQSFKFSNEGKEQRFQCKIRGSCQANALTTVLVRYTRNENGSGLDSTQP
eukprot:sb/3467219/